jgi:hypothetical protein
MRNLLLQKRSDNKFYFTPLFVAIFGSGIQDTGSKIWDPRSGIRDGQKSGSRINIPDPQHWINK